jgi:hypothetical protein
MLSTLALVSATTSKNNGPPGWRTLAYGMQELLSMASAWEAALAFGGKSPTSCDR